MMSYADDISTSQNYETKTFSSQQVQVQKKKKQKKKFHKL